MTDHTTPATGSGLLTLAEAADYLRAPVATLQYWRHLGSGPAGFRIGRRVMYHRQDIDRWIATQQEAESVRR
ncbi:helix-turn-helix domain-containing protein [Geodermatophilus nigrescens]